MADRIIGTVALSIAALVAIHAVFGRMLGFHRDVTWTGGGNMTLVAELSAAGFVASVGSGFVFASPTFILPALLCWVAGFISQERANRRFRREEETLRAKNSKQHPGIFDSDPPTSLDLDEVEYVDVYDCGSCAYLGRIAAQRIRELIDATAVMPDQGPNDIFVIEETLEPPMMDEAVELKAFLREHLDARGYAVLRWLPVQNSK